MANFFKNTVLTISLMASAGQSLICGHTENVMTAARLDLFDVIRPASNPYGATVSDIREANATILAPALQALGRDGFVRAYVEGVMSLPEVKALADGVGRNQEYCIKPVKQAPAALELFLPDGSAKQVLVGVDEFPTSLCDHLLATAGIDGTFAEFMASQEHQGNAMAAIRQIITSKGGRLAQSLSSGAKNF